MQWLKRWTYCAQLIITFQVLRFTTQNAVHSYSSIHHSNSARDKLVSLGTYDDRAFFVDTSIYRNWTEANKTCTGFGMKLATIDSKSQERFLAKKFNVTTYYMWTAGRDAQTLGEFVWDTNKRPLSRELNWRRIDVRAPISNCLAFHGGLYGILTCSTKCHTLCEIKVYSKYKKSSTEKYVSKPSAKGYGSTKEGYITIQTTIGSTKKQVPTTQETSTTLAPTTSVTTSKLPTTTESTTLTTITTSAFTSKYPETETTPKITSVSTSISTTVGSGAHNARTDVSTMCVCSAPTSEIQAHTEVTPTTGIPENQIKSTYSHATNKETTEAEHTQSSEIPESHISNSHESTNPVKSVYVPPTHAPTNHSTLVYSHETHPPVKSSSRGLTTQEPKTQAFTVHSSHVPYTQITTKAEATTTTTNTAPTVLTTVKTEKTTHLVPEDTTTANEEYEYEPEEEVSTELSKNEYRAEEPMTDEEVDYAADEPMTDGETEYTEEEPVGDEETEITEQPTEMEVKTVKPTTITTKEPPRAQSQTKRRNGLFGKGLLSSIVG